MRGNLLTASPLQVDSGNLTLPTFAFAGLILGINPQNRASSLVAVVLCNSFGSLAHSCTLFDGRIYSLGSPAGHRNLLARRASSERIRNFCGATIRTRIHQEASMLSILSYRAKPYTNRNGRRRASPSIGWKPRSLRRSVCLAATVPSKKEVFDRRGQCETAGQKPCHWKPLESFDLLLEMELLVTSGSGSEWRSPLKISSKQTPKPYTAFSSVSKPSPLARIVLCNGDLIAKKKKCCTQPLLIVQPHGPIVLTMEFRVASHPIAIVPVHRCL